MIVQFISCIGAQLHVLAVYLELAGVGNLDQSKLLNMLFTCLLANCLLKTEIEVLPAQKEFRYFGDLSVLKINKKNPNCYLVR